MRSTAFLGLTRVSDRRIDGSIGRLKIDEDLIGASLYTASCPDPDLLIRTSGEMRISNFLLWQIAYAELYVTETLWPDFTRSDLLQAVLDYQKRDRRYGAVTSEPAASKTADRSLGSSLRRPRSPDPRSPDCLPPQPWDAHRTHARSGQCIGP